MFLNILDKNERKNFLNFTKPYIQAPLVVVTRNDEIFISNISEIEKLLLLLSVIVKVILYFILIFKKIKHFLIKNKKNWFLHK